MEEDNSLEKRIYNKRIRAQQTIELSKFTVNKREAKLQEKVMSKETREYLAEI